LRNRLMTIARISSLMVDADSLAQIPLTRGGVDDPRYRAIADVLLKIKKTAPSITYIYTLARTDTPTVFRFIVDPEPKKDGVAKSAAYPGDVYDASAFPELVKGWDGPAADKKLGKDEWGVFMSGYAPIRDASGRTVAILGVDMSANDVRSIQDEVGRRVWGVLVVATILSIILGMIVSSRVTGPIERLVAGTRYLARGELGHRVPVSGDDEVAELGRSFNRMASDLKTHIDELKRTTAEKERLLKELEIAKGIQQSFLPDSAPVIKGVDIAAVTVPARVVGGDFYDFIPFGPSRWGLVVADVSGKGIPAALFMALSRTLVRASVHGAASAAEAIKHANQLILEDSKANMFVTLFYAILDADKMTLEYANAGHNPPLFLSDNLCDIVLLKAQGVPLGLMPNMDLHIDTVTLKPGNVVALYTDGVTEAINDAGERFEIERLSETICKNRDLPAAEIIGKTQAAITQFVENQPQYVDITIMVLKAL
jgi:serine phosphatase RsbU (regulator of sigma subunit)